jgi:dienelactone hydrolase
LTARCYSFLFLFVFFLVLSDGSLLFSEDRTATVSKASGKIFQKQLTGQGSLPAKYKATDVTYFLHVPDNYNKESQYAFIMCISPGSDGRVMFLAWEKACKKHSIFFACPNNAGNPVNADRRGQMAVDVMFDVINKYAIDPQRIFVSGFSGGGRMSTAMVVAFPEYFAGHIPAGGIMYSRNANDVGALKTRLGHTIFAGEKCFNRKESEVAASIMSRAGVPVQLFIGPNQAHEYIKPEMGLKMIEWFLEKMKTEAGGKNERIALRRNHESKAKTIEQQKALREKTADEELKRADALKVGGKLEEAFKLYQHISKDYPDTSSGKIAR